MAADVESLITIAASIILGNQVSTPDATAQSVRIITALDNGQLLSKRGINRGRVFCFGATGSFSTKLRKLAAQFGGK